MYATAADLSDTIAAISTPPGMGAIAVVRLAGPRAVEIADRFFRGKKLLAASPSHTAHFGAMMFQEAMLDEVVATVFRAPHSYTGDEIVELSCHGSLFIQQKILGLLLESGARLARPGEFTLRAFLNGKMDLAQAEAVADLIASESAAAHDIALRQMRGGFSFEIKKLREELIHFASLIELELDFAEEDVEFANRLTLNGLVEKIRVEIARLIQSFQLGNALKTGVTTVIAGRPNAGKSTLLNALLNEERAIVSDVPGTTRDAIEEVLNIGGVLFRLVDTAGIREATDAVERIGVERAMEKIGQAAILVYLFDVVETRLAEVFFDLEKLAQPGLKLLVVCNKMDLLPQFSPSWLADPFSKEIPPFLLGDFSKIPNPAPLAESQIVTLSAKHSMNVPFLKEKLLDLVTGGSVSTGGTVVTNARHVAALQQADAALTDVSTGLASGVSTDFVAMDIRRALSFLGEITGEIGVEDLLGSIFSKFCIGK